MINNDSYYFKRYTCNSNYYNCINNIFNNMVSRQNKEMKILKNIKETPLIDLLHEIDKIEKDIEKLIIERNEIIFELWKRVPNLENEDEFQVKVLKK